MQVNNYYIKKGYIENLNDEGEVVKKYTSPPMDKIWQIEVYKYAATVLKLHGLEKVIEFGSGSGYKLMKYISPITKNITGIDFEHSIRYCKNTYRAGNWISLDLDKSHQDFDGPYDLIMAIDVIEHLVSPEKMLEQMKSCAKENSLLLISTPERDLVRGYDTYGPPDNKKHVREWNFEELSKYISSQGLKIVDHRLVRAKKYTPREWFYHIRKRKPLNTCQVVLCKLA